MERIAVGFSIGKAGASGIAAGTLSLNTLASPMPISLHGWRTTKKSARPVLSRIRQLPKS
jgi:hypothetical protein